MTLKLEDIRGILKMYLHTENEAANLRPKRRAQILEKYENMSKSKCKKL